MKRKLLAFSVTLALLLSVLLTANVGAFPVTADGSRSEWFGQEPDTSGQGMIARNAAGQGEWIFNDAKGDVRNIVASTTAYTREADIDVFSVTGDASAISFLLRVDRYSGVTNDPRLDIKITVDTNQGNDVGQRKLAGLSNTETVSVTSDAAWEYQIDATVNGTSNGDNTGPVNVKIWKGAATSASNCSTTNPCSARVASAGAFQGSLVEVRVPWANFTGTGGGKPAADKPWRFTVSTFLKSGSGSGGSYEVPTDGNTSAVIDVLGTKKTIDDLNNTPANTIDTSFDVFFNAAGEPYSPLLITEFQPNPVGQDDPTRTSATETEWVEIYNPNTFDLSLANYKIGDAAKRGASSEAMLKFPGGSTITAGKFVIVARDKAKFTAKYGANPGGATVYGVSDLSSYSAWSSGGASNFDLANGPSAGATTFEEQVVLLDAKDTIADLVNYAWTGTTATPNNIPIQVASSTDVPEGASYERCPASIDTNDNSRDFAQHPAVANQTPGAACAAVQGVDLSIGKAGPPNISSDANTPVQYVIVFRNDGTAPAQNVVINDTVPSQVTFVSQQSDPAANFDQATMTWTYSTLAPGATGTITVEATLNAGAGFNTPFTNNASINSNPQEDMATRANNVASFTVITEGPADLNVSSTIPAKVAPGKEFEYTIAYANTGQSDAENVTITQTLPNGVTLVSEDSPDLEFNGATTGTLVWSTSTLLPNQTGTITVRARLGSTAQANTQLPFTVSIGPSTGDLTPDNNTETKSATVGFYSLYLPLIRK